MIVSLVHFLSDTHGNTNASDFHSHKNLQSMSAPTRLFDLNKWIDMRTGRQSDDALLMLFTQSGCLMMTLTV